MSMACHLYITTPLLVWRAYLIKSDSDLRVCVIDLRTFPNETHRMTVDIIVRLVTGEFICMGEYSSPEHLRQLS